MSKNATRVRVEATKYDGDAALRRAFKAACKDAGVMHTYKEHQTYESKARKKRRKQREFEITRMKNKLKENFLQQGKK